MVTSCNDYHNIVASLALFTARDIGIIRGRHCVWCIQIFEMFLDCCLIVYNAYVIVWSSVFVASFTTQVYWFVAAAAAGCCGPWLHCILEWHFRIVQNVVCHFLCVIFTLWDCVAMVICCGIPCPPRLSFRYRKLFDCLLHIFLISRKSILVNQCMHCVEITRISSFSALYSLITI